MPITKVDFERFNEAADYLREAAKHLALADAKLTEIVAKSEDPHAVAVALSMLARSDRNKHVYLDEYTVRPQSHFAGKLPNGDDAPHTRDYPSLLSETP